MKPEIVDQSDPLPPSLSVSISVSVSVSLSLSLSLSHVRALVCISVSVSVKAARFAGCISQMHPEWQEVSVHFWKNSSDLTLTRD